MLSILYLTDNTLDKKIANFCIDDLIYCATGSGVDEDDHWVENPIPIIAVSQKPIEIKDPILDRDIKNICVGEIGRSWKSLYTQILAGLNACETEYIAIAEHDCLYGSDHFDFTPQEDRFYYNRNHWLVNWGTGEYFYISFRKAMSQLVCKTLLLRDYAEGMIKLIDRGLEIKPGYRWYGEPGLYADKYKEYFKRSGINEDLKKDFVKHISKFESSFFTTENPNLDIRHDNNFTGRKKGREYCTELPYWGKFSEVVDEANS